MPHDQETTRDGGKRPGIRDGAERELRRVNRALRVLSECNQALVRAEAREALLEDVCRILVEHGGYRMAWVGFARDDPGRTVLPAATAGDETGYLDRVSIGWGDDERGRGPSGVAIRTGTTQVNRDFRSNPTMAPWREEALSRGFESSIALPLKGEGISPGVLGVYASEPDAFDRAEVELLEELATDLAYGLATLHAREGRRRAEAMVTRLAYFDTLTALPNRTQLLERMEGSSAAARASGRSFALVTINVNRFDDIQIGLGVREGDEALRLLAARLAGALGERAFLARVGGDVFGALVEDGGAEAAGETARRVHEALSEPFRLAGILIDVQASVGAAIFPAHGTDAEALLLRSNIACRQARRAGLGFALYSGATDAESPRQLVLVGELRRAISAGELVLHYQPKIDLRSGGVTGFEALVRWQHPARGLVPPAEFIAAAERTGLIKALTLRVMEEALRQARRWRERGHALPVAVNVSPSSLRDPEFLERVVEAQERCGALGGELAFEITESTLMEDPARSHDLLMQLRERGISLYIDDFGTGYSSLGYIATLPIQGLKIDRTFVAGMTAAAPVRSVVEATVSLARALQMRVVAEGVETRAQAEELARMGCDEVQGFLYGRPAVARECEDWLAGAAAG